MQGKVIELLRKKKATSLNLSLGYTDHSNKATHEKSEYVKSAIKSDFKDFPTKAIAAREAYYNCYTYYKRTAPRAFSTPTKRNFSLWVRMSAAIEKAEVDPVVYMKKQFEFYHKVFGTLPKPHFLTTDAAVSRVRESVANNEPTVAVRSIPSEGADLATTFRRCEDMIRSVARTHSLTREEVYTRFVLTGLLPLPDIFLKADSVYIKVASAR